MKAPEELARFGDEEHFLIALARDGVTELDPPVHLASSIASWRQSEHVPIDVGSYLDVLADSAAGRVVVAFAGAVERGFSACVAQLSDPLAPPYLLSFWNRLDVHDCVIVLAKPAAPGSVGDPSDGLEPVVPLRCVQHLDPFGVTTHIDDATRIMLGWGDDAIGVSRMQYQHADDIGEGIRSWAQLIDVPDAAFVHRSRFRNAAGNYRWYDCRVENRLHTHGHVEVEMIDVHEHIRTHPPQRVTTEVADALAAQTEHGIVVLDHDQFVIAVNDRFVEMSGLGVDPSSRRLLVGSADGDSAVLAGIRRHLEAGDREVSREFGTDGALIEFRTVGTGADPTQSVLLVKIAGTSSSQRALPKGLSSPTLALVRSVLGDLPEGQSLGSQDLAVRTELSEVTVRRYLSHLIEAGAVAVDHEFGSRGRPRKRFRLTAGSA